MGCLFMNCCQKKKHAQERINNELRDGMGIRSPQFALQFSLFPPQHPQQQQRYHQGLLLPLYHEPLLLRLLKSLWKMLLLPSLQKLHKILIYVFIFIFQNQQHPLQHDCPATKPHLGNSVLSRENSAPRPTSKMPVIKLHKPIS